MNFPELPWSSTGHKPAVTRAPLDGGATARDLHLHPTWRPQPGRQSGERGRLRLSEMLWEIWTARPLGLLAQCRVCPHERETGSDLTLMCADIKGFPGLPLTVSLRQQTDLVWGWLGHFETMCPWLQSFVTPIS